jgi:hypothetical protein
MGLKKFFINDLFGYPIGISCESKNIELKVCNKATADSIISKHHYSKKPTKNSFLSLVVYHNGIASGALQLGYGIRPKIKGEYNPDEIREFDRMWLSDDMPKFSETIVISMLHNFLKKNYPNIKALISYCDTSVGNTGTIYRAANYKLIDTIKADFYIL